MLNLRVNFHFSALILYLLVLPQLIFADQNRVAVYADWAVFKAENPKECWAASTSRVRSITPHTPQNVRRLNRMDILLMATISSTSNYQEFVSFSPGYVIDGDNQVTLEVSGESYVFSYNNEWAWPAGGALADAAIIQSLIESATATLTVAGQASSKDTFSLDGFGAAWRTVQKLCG